MMISLLLYPDGNFHVAPSSSNVGLLNCHACVMYWATIGAPQTCSDIDFSHHYCCQVDIRFRILTSFIDVTFTHAAVNC